MPTFKSILSIRMTYMSMVDRTPLIFLERLKNGREILEFHKII